MFQLIATTVALAHGRPEAGYPYSKPIISTVPSSVYGVPDSYENGGFSSYISGGNIAFAGANNIIGHGLTGGSFHGSTAGGSSADFTSHQFASGGSSFVNGIGLQGGSIGNTAIESDDAAGGIFGGGGGTLVQKHIYVHVPPHEPEELRPARPISITPAQKHYKIIFIKAPTAPTPTAPVIPVHPQVEEKTLVYVLVKRPDEQPEIHIPTPAPTQPSKPEVYFIRYKTQKQAGAGGDTSILSGGTGGRTSIITDANSSNIGEQSGILSSIGGSGIGSTSIGGTDHAIGVGGQEFLSSSSISSSSHSQSHSHSSASSSISSSYGPPAHNTGY